MVARLSTSYETNLYAGYEKQKAIIYDRLRCIIYFPNNYTSYLLINGYWHRYDNMKINKFKWSINLNIQFFGIFLLAFQGKSNKYALNELKSIKWSLDFPVVFDVCYIPLLCSHKDPKSNAIPLVTIT